MSRLQQRLQDCQDAGRAALIPYITAGDPTPAWSVRLMHALVAGGADVIELGVPFSDPMADGPTIQLACERALAAGTTLPRVLEMVAEFRRTDPQTPVVLMGYLNPLLRDGEKLFCERAKAAGVDGVLAVDLTVEETDTLLPALRHAELDCIFLLAPTTSQERARRMSEAGSGYLYYVSLKGVTGSAALDVGAVQQRLQTLREVVSLPIAVGFGIRTRAHVAAIAQTADGIVIGSTLVEQIAAHAEQPDGLPDLLQSTLAELRAGIEDAQAQR